MRPIELVLVMDTTGSMASSGKMDGAKAAAEEARADLLIAVGGGSVIVGVRAVSIFMSEAGDPFELPHLLAAQAQTERELPALEALQPGRRIHVGAQDPLLARHAPAVGRADERLEHEVVGGPIGPRSGRGERGQRGDHRGLVPRAQGGDVDAEGPGVAGTVIIEDQV